MLKQLRLRREAECYRYTAAIGTYYVIRDHDAGRPNVFTVLRGLYGADHAVLGLEVPLVDARRLILEDVNERLRAASEEQTAADVAHQIARIVTTDPKALKYLRTLFSGRCTEDAFYAGVRYGMVHGLFEFNELAHVQLKRPAD